MKIRKEARIGLFAVLILLLLYCGVNFLKGRDLWNRNMTYYAYFDNVNGLQLSSPIIIKGISVGQVTGITFRPDLDNRVEVRFDVRSEYRIPDNSIVRLYTNGLMGGKAFEIELGDSVDALPDGATIRAESKPGLFEIDGSEIDYYKEQIGALINSLDRVTSSLNKLLSENSEQIAGAFVGLRQGVESFARKGEEIGQIIDHVNTVTATLADGSERIDSTLTDLKKVSGQLAEADLGQTMNDLDRAVEELNRLLAAANSPEGSLNRFLSDGALYDSLTQASSNLSALLRDVKENPQRYVHISVFGGNKNKK